MKVLRRFAHELVAFQRCREGLGVLADHFPHASQPNIFTSAWRAWEGDHVFDRFTHWKLAFRCEEHARRTDIPGLAPDFRPGTVRDDFEGETQFEALVLSLFHHGLF